jgi:outer membrane protein TolC
MSSPVPTSSYRPGNAGACGARRSIRNLLAAWVLAGVALGAAAAEPLSLDAALDLAEKDAPQLAAQSAAVSAAADEAIRAPQLPDPQLIAGIDNLPVDTSDRFSLTRDFMTMRKIGLAQEFPRKEKRRLRGELAEADVRKEQAQLTAQRLDVRRETAAAWIARHVAERERELLLALRDQADLTVAATRAAVAGGKRGSAELIAATSDRVQLDDRIDVASRDVEQAQAALARWIGADAASRPLGEPPDFSRLDAAPAALLANVPAYASLLPYDALEARAETDVALARSEKLPDWSVEVAYAQRGPAYSNMLSVQFRVDLPLFAAHRQDPAIAAKLAQLDRVRAEREDALRMRRQETAQAIAAWTTAQKRLDRSRNELLPLADQRAEVALAAYRGGGDLAAVIAARTAQIEARTAYITQLGELARAWATLNYLIPARE